MRRRSLLLAAGAAAIALGAAGSAQAQKAPEMYIAWSETSRLLVQPAFDRVAPPVTGISIVAFGPERWPSQVTIDAPRGYKRVAVPPGTWVGRGVLSLGNVASEPAIAAWDGRIVADDPARYATDPCAPGAHAAVWLLSLAGLEQEQGYEIPLFVDAFGNRLRIRFCVPDMRPAGGRFLILGMSLTGVIALPSATGRYVWSAHVTPFAPAAPAGDAATAYELRSAVLVPHRLTIRARYDLESDVAVLRGRLTGAAQARAGVKVFFGGFTGPNFSGFRMLGSAKTDAKGAYVFRARIAERTTFVAAADARAKPCSSTPSTAPSGCLAETTSPPPSVSAAIAPG